MKARRQIGARHIARMRGAFKGRQKSKAIARPKAPARCTIANFASGRREEGRVRWSGATGHAGGGGWANQPTRSRMARHGAPERERVADSGMGRDESFTCGRHGGGRRRARSGGQ